MSFLKLKKHNLLVAAAIVWVIAGANILHIGLEAYGEGFVSGLNLVLSVVVGVLFGSMFYRLTVKHTNRIVGYEEPRQYFWHFFDLKSFIIMAVMMTGGISLRMFHLVPDGFIAVFYTGLGAALALAGIVFAWNRLRVSHFVAQAA